MNKTELIQYLRANEIWAKKSMGQNFLVDEDALAKIVEAADIQPSDTILEIGPGLGVLTQELSKLAGKVVAIEKDDKFVEALRIQFKNSNVEIIHQDALEFDPVDIYGYKVVANIPYNITSLIIRKFLEAKNTPSLVVLLVQKEVAERIVAKPGDMSVLAVSVQFYAEAEIIADVSKESFFPVPKVDSAVIRLEIRSVKPEVSQREFFRLIKFGFAAKRKTLENNLAAGMHIKKDEAADIILEAGLDPRSRAEDLSIENWLALHKVIEEGNGRERTRQNP